jgi:hypothetical protein
MGLLPANFYPLSFVVMFAVCEIPYPLRVPGLGLALAFRYDLPGLPIPFLPMYFHLLSPRHFCRKVSDSPKDARTRN